MTDPGPVDADLFLGEEPILAWRANTVLVDAGHRHAWLAGVHHQRRYGVEATAVCDVEDHPAPASGCHCGLHAWPDRGSAEEYGRRWGQAAICRVELTGEVVCHGEPGTEEIEGYRASNMTTLGVEFDGRCWRCGRDATTLAALSDQYEGVRIARGHPGGLQHLVPACERCAGGRALAPADLAALLGTDVRLRAEPTGPPSFLRRVADELPTRSLAFLVGAGAVLAVALLGMIGAVLEGSWATGVLFGATTVGAVLGAFFLARGRGTRRTAMALAAATVALVIVGPVLATFGVAGSTEERAPAVMAVLNGSQPDSTDAFTAALVAAGASDVQVTDIGPDHRATSLVVDGRCWQVGLSRSTDDPTTWNVVGTQSIGPALVGRCPPAYPVPTTTDQPTDAGGPSTTAVPPTTAAPTP